MGFMGFILAFNVISEKCLSLTICFVKWYWSVASLKGFKNLQDKELALWSS